MSSKVRLDAASVEAVAARVVELLDEQVASTGSPAAAEMIDAAEVARRFGVARGWAYEHAEFLGAIRLGSGPRARLRFDAAIVAERLSPCSASRASESTISRTPSPIAPRRRRRPKGTERELLPIRPPGGRA